MTAFTPETRNKITITWRNAMKEKGTLLPASEQKLLEDPCLYMIVEVFIAGVIAILRRCIAGQDIREFCIVEIQKREGVQKPYDAGQPEAFLHLLSVIENNNLIRYTAVRRAVYTWTGIWDERGSDKARQKAGHKFQIIRISADDFF